MKKSAFLLVISLAASALFSCDEGLPVSSETTPETTAPTQAAPTETSAEAPTEANIPTSLPVLAIQTKNTSPDAIKFVTEPVSRHVAEAISSWTPGYKMPPEPYYEDCYVTLTNSDGSAALSQSSAQVKVRGNWTTVYDKKPLRIKFDEKQSLLGLNDGAEQRNWLLLAEYKDASMLRNRAALYASREILSADGLFAADTELVQVEINGEYFGMYLLADMQQVSSHRVNVTEPEKGYTGTDIGYFLEFDGYYVNEDELHGFPLDLADNAPLLAYDGGSDEVWVQALPKDSSDPVKPVGVSIKSTVNSQEQHDFIESFVNNIYTIMYEAAYNDKAFVFNSSYTAISETSSLTPQQAVENVVDVQSLADMYIISELTCDADIYWSSFFMDVDFGADGNKKLTFEAPWDFDSAMGNKDRCIDGKGYYASNKVPDVNGGSKGGGEYDTVNPWLVVLAHEDWYRDIVKSTWTRAYDNGVFDRTVELIENDKVQFRDDFEKNYQKWNNIKNNGDFVNELSAPARKCRTEEEAADFLIEWLENRVEFLNSEFHE